MSRETFATPLSRLQSISSAATAALLLGVVGCIPGASPSVDDDGDGTADTVDNAGTTEPDGTTSPERDAAPSPVAGGGTENDTGGASGGDSPGGDVAVGGDVGAVPGGDTGAGEDTGANTVWRPFTDDSPWNTPIPANAELEPDSAGLIEDMAGSSPFGRKVDINISGYSIPLYFVNSSTPTVPVTADIGGQGWGAGGFNATFDMPIPPGAAPDPEGDGHLAVVDLERGLEWGCWTMDGSGRHAGLCATSDLTGTGVRPRADQASPWWDAHGARACGFPLSAGLIRPEEIEAGHIRHALVIAYPHIRAGFYTPPASTAQARVGDNSVSTRGIPCGGRVQLDPAVDVDAMDASPAAKVVLRALQEYGAYVGDYSGAISLYADGSPDAKARWSGVLDTASVADVLDFADLRVLRMGPLFDNGNGG